MRTKERAVGSDPREDFAFIFGFSTLHVRATKLVRHRLRVPLPPHVGLAQVGRCRTQRRGHAAEKNQQSTLGFLIPPL